MKRIIMSALMICGWSQLFSQEEPKDSFYTLSPVEVRAVRATDNAPISKTNLSKSAISKMNLGQDIPYLLNQTPSVVINSDAGNGVGYTGIRIRGTDATRINITLNGIPYNDAESQGTFFVDLPDFSSSTGSIQVQRGVGSSSNGSGAFGASINFSTNETNKDAYLELNNSLGSFNTWKNTLRAGTGIIKKYSADFRLSRISSDGFIDRASSNLKSFYFSLARMGEKNSIRMNIFSGKEKTYQAWYGVPESDLRVGNRRVNYAGTEKPGNPYDNETDNYTQTHYQLFFNQVINPKLHFNTAFFLTRGKGYYEQYKADKDYSDFGLPYPVNGTDTIFSADFIRQLWLDNYYYGNIFSFQYDHRHTRATVGGAYTRYDGNHYGMVNWSSRSLISPHRWYNLDAKKKDLTIYYKQETRFCDYWTFYFDLQYRHVFYNINGFRDNPGLLIRKPFDFFNPKAGIVFRKNGWKAYYSFSIAGKEPNRDDFEAGSSQQPRAERLYDSELGFEHSGKQANWSLTLFHMYYKDQLVLTGRINDVGAYTRTNIPVSYRAGAEWQGAATLSKRFHLSGNLSMSTNKVKNFTEYIDDYDNGGQKTKNYRESDIAYSPSLTGAATISYLPVNKIEISILSKYVGNQYLDNTRDKNRMLNHFFLNDLRAIYTLKTKKLKEFQLIAQLNNLFNVKYEPNGYTFSYFYGGITSTENYYFPMAGTNFMVAANIRL